MNANRFEQDHPCLIETIRRLYLHPPADDANDPVANSTKVKKNATNVGATYQDVLKRLNYKVYKL